jgi:hypothetical protein
MGGGRLPLGVIVRKEGGWRDVTAIRAAVTRVMNCLVLEGKFVKWNSMSERIEFLFTRTHHIETFERIWMERTHMKEATSRVSGGVEIEKSADQEKDKYEVSDKAEPKFKAKVLRTESKKYKPWVSLDSPFPDPTLRLCGRMAREWNGCAPMVWGWLALPILNVSG